MKSKEVVGYFVPYQPNFGSFQIVHTSMAMIVLPGKGMVYIYIYIYYIGT